MEGVQTPSIQRVGDIVDGYLRPDNNSNIEGVQTPSIQRVIWDVMGCGLPNYLCGGRMWAPKLSLGWLKICLGFIIPTMIFLSQPLAFMWQSLAFLLPSIYNLVKQKNTISCEMTCKMFDFNDKLKKISPCMSWDVLF